MTPEQFDAWWSRHKTLHPPVAAWANQLATESRAALREQWATTLAEVALEAASRVSERMLAGEVPDVPSWDLHKLAGIVRRHAREMRSYAVSRPRRPDDSYACLACRDTGYREVYSPRGIREALAGHPRPRTCNVLCDCLAGGRILELQPDWWRESQRYHPDRWCEVGEDVAEWLANRREERAASNYEPAFEAGAW